MPVTTIAAKKGGEFETHQVVNCLKNSILKKSASVASANNLNISYTTKTSGDLTIGQRYEILVSGTGDWTNVGAANNNVGTQFTATGTTPTSWGGGTLAVASWTGQIIDVTGATEIQTLSIKFLYDGARVTLLFASTPQVTHENGSSSDDVEISLIGGANITAAAGDILELEYRASTDKWHHIRGLGNFATVSEFNGVLISYAASANFIAQRANGSEGSETAVLDTEIIGKYSYKAHNGTSYVENASISAIATENQSVGNAGAYLDFKATANGSATPETVAEFRESGITLNRTLNVNDIDGTTYLCRMYDSASNEIFRIQTVGGTKWRWLYNMSGTNWYQYAPGNNSLALTTQANKTTGGDNLFVGYNTGFGADGSTQLCTILSSNHSGSLSFAGIIGCTLVGQSGTRAGNYSTLIGLQASGRNQTTSVGSYAGNSNNSLDNSVAIGYEALENIGFAGSGSHTAVGFRAGKDFGATISTARHIFIGFDSGNSLAVNADGLLQISSYAFGVNGLDKAIIAGRQFTDGAENQTNEAFNQKLYLGGDVRFGLSNGSALWVKRVSDTITITVGNGAAGVASSTNLAPKGLIVGCSAITTQAAGGGATLADIKITGAANVDQLIANLDTTASTGKESIASANAATTFPIRNTSSTTITITTDSDVTVSDLIIRVTVYYIDIDILTS